MIASEEFYFGRLFFEVTYQKLPPSSVTFFPEHRIAG